MKFTLIRLIMASIWITCAYKWGDWKAWERYYPTMLFFGMGDLIYNAVFHQTPLWKFQSDFLIPPLNELFVIFNIFFSTTLLYLSKFPKKLYHQITYIVFWILLYVGIELFTLSISMIKHCNGWNIWWSLAHNAIQFPLLTLHHKNPALAWVISFLFLFIMMYIFNVPFTISK